MSKTRSGTPRVRSPPQNGPPQRGFREQLATRVAASCEYGSGEVANTSGRGENYRLWRPSQASCVSKVEKWFHKGVLLSLVLKKEAQHASPFPELRCKSMFDNFPEGEGGSVDEISKDAYPGGPLLAACR